MTSIRRALGGAAGLTTIGILVVGPAWATGEETVVVGTGWQRQPSDIVCYSSCGTVDWTHKLDTGCSKVADARLRYVKDFAPDETHAADYNFTGCSVRSYRHGVDAGRPHHQDGRVDAGSATMTFGYKAS